MKKKVLYHALNASDATSFYRIGGVLPYIQNHDFELVDGSGINDWNWASFIGVSVFIFQRPFTQEHANLILLAKDMGVKVILDYDDDLLNVDMYNGTFDLYNLNRTHCMRCIRLADEVWVSTQGIKKSFGKLNKNIHVIKNAHNDFLFPVKDKVPFNKNSKNVIWRGGGSHEADVYEVADQLVKVINKHPDWNFNFWGHRFTFLEQRCGENYICRMGMSLMQYFKALREYNPCIAIYPLSNTPFNQSKSNICWIETTYVGAAFFGNIGLPEFNNKCIVDINKLDKMRQFEEADLVNMISWDYIEEHLLLSNINKIREERIIANL